MKPRHVYKLHLEALAKIEQQGNVIRELITQHNGLCERVEDLETAEPDKPRTGFRKPREEKRNDVP